MIDGARKLMGGFDCHDARLRRLISSASPARRCFLAVLLLAAVRAPLPAQSGGPARPEVIRGRVTSDSSDAIAGATVIATMAPDRISQQATTDADGRYELRFEQGTGDYLVYSIAPGYRAFRRRVTLTAAASSLIADIRLIAEPTAQQLNAVRVAARRPRPIPDVASQPDPAAIESFFEGVPAALSPDQYGNLFAMAATVPGVTIGPDGQLIVNGVSGQVSTTLNGMATNASDVPADVVSRVRVTSSSWDPAIGGFGGARVNVELANSGSPLTSYTVGHFFLDAPPLQYNDATSSQLGGRITRLDMGAASAGPLVEDKWYYNSGFTVRRSTNNAPTFLSGSPTILALAGLSPDSALRARQILSRLGVPFTGGGAPSERVTESVSMVGWIGYLPRALGGARNAGVTRPPTNFYFTGVLNASNTGAPGALTAAPAFGSSSSAVSAQLSASGFHSFVNDALTEGQSSFGIHSTRSTPYLQLPGGVVRVESVLPDGSAAISSLGFGGAQSERKSDYASWETTSTSQFYIGNTHRIKVFVESHLEWFTQSSSQNALGTFTYNSLHDLETNQPAAYTRSLVTPSTAGGELSGVLGVGDFWQVTPDFRMEYSARLDGNHFGNAPDFNPAVSSQFGLSTAHVPNTLEAEPRAGFVWQYGSASTRPSFLNSAFARVTAPPRGVLSGGFGEFRNVLSPVLVSGAMANTGLSSSADRLFCVGAATPQPAWSAYESGTSAVPTQCAPGANPALSDAAPSVQLLDPTYTAPRTWRGVLQWASALGWLRFSLNATYALNLDQPDVRDLNFAGTQQFSLANEANRPVFVPVANIVPATGSLTSTGARRNAAFGSVYDLASDLQSTSRSLTLVMVPYLPESRLLVTFAYTLADVRDQARGFADASTFGSPADLQSGRSSFDIRHTLMASAGFSFSAKLFVNAYVNVRSGVPYTPLVSGDVNGDGLSNDRAFVFDPARVNDAALANGMNSLLGSAPSQARSCLLRQLNAPAARNSCDGPWTASLNMNAISKRYRVFDGRLMRYSLTASNVLGGLDELLHGGNLQGWGAPALPNPYLYFVRGFDPVAKQFQYDVNPRFGDTRSSQTTVRAPFRMTLQFTMELGTPSDRQTVHRIMNPGRAGRAGMRMAADSIRAIYQESIGDIYEELFREKDSLLITAPQMAALVEAHKRYITRTDSLWAGFGTWVAAQDDDYDAKEVVRQVDKMADGNAAIARDELPRIRAILTKVQASLAYAGVGDMLSGRSQRPYRFDVRR